MLFDPEALTKFETTHIYKGELTGLNKDGEVTLYYEVPLGGGAETVSWLRENRQTILDITVDFQKLEGVWRSVNIEQQQSVTTKGSVRILQTFKQGWIESLVAGSAIIWTEARLVRSNLWKAAQTQGSYPVSEDNNPQQYYIIEWTGLNPEKLDTVAKSLRDLSPIGIAPTVEGEELGSGFTILDVISDINQDYREKDKSGKITLLIAKPRVNLQAWENYGTPVQAKVYYLYDVPLYIAQTLINSYNMRTGTTASASQPNERSLVAITVKDKNEEDSTNSAITERSCAFFVKTTYYYGYDAPVTLPENSIGTTYSGRFDLDRSTGTYTGWIAERVRQTQHITSYRGENTHEQYTMRERWVGAYTNSGVLQEATLSVSAGNISKAYANITLPDDTIALGNTWQISKRENEDCTIDIDISERIEIEVADVDYDSADNNAAKTTATEKMNREPVTITLAAGSNESLRANVRYNKDTGLLDVTEETTVSKQLDGSETTESASSTRVATKKRKSSVEPTDPVYEAGKVKTTVVDETEFADRFDTTVIVDTAKNQTSTGGASRADQTSSISIQTEAAAEVAATPQAGKIVNVSNRPTDHGLFATSQEVITPIDQTSTSGDDRGDRTSTTVEHTQASSAIIAPPAAATGTIVTVQNRETEFGLFNTREEVVTAKELGVTHVSLSGAAQTEETIRARNAASKADAIAIEGKIVRASSQKNEFNLYDNTVETITPIDQTGHAAQLRADQTSDIDTHTQSDTVADETPVTGKIVNADSQPTEFGKYRTRREVVTPVNQDGSAEEVRADRTSTTDTNTQSETEADATPVTGKIVQTQNRPTEFGKFSTSRTEITPVEQTTTHDSTARADQTAERTIATNAAAKQDATPVAGKVVNASSKENEFGKFDNTLETITPIDQTAISNTEAHNEAIDEEVHTQADEALADAIEVVGEINEASSVPTEFGKFRTTDRTRTAKEQTVTHSSEVRADQTADRTWESNAATKADAEDAGDGVITRATSQENGFGLFDNVKETTTAIDQTGAGASESHSESMTEETHTQGDALEDPVETTGKITENASRPTAFGKYATTSRERSGKLQSVTHASESRADQTTERVWESNADEKADADEVDGKIVQATSQENPFGLFDNTKQTITPKDQESTNGAEGHLSSSETKTHTQNDAEEDAGTPSAGQRISVDNQPTPFGKFRTAKQTETAIEIITTDHGISAINEEEKIKTWNGSKIESAPSRGDGTTVALIQSPTPFKDKWDIVEETDTGTPWDTGWLSWETATGTKYYRQWGNQAESFHTGIIASFDDTTENSINPSYNRYGLWDGSASKNPRGDATATFWRSTTEETVVDEIEEDRRLDTDSSSGVKTYIDYYRTRTVTYKSVIVQTLGVADITKRQYISVPDVRTRMLRLPKITPYSDAGRNGFLVDVWYETLSEWNKRET